MKKIKCNNIEVFNKVSTLHIVMHYEKSCAQSSYFHANRTHKICKKQPCVLWNLKKWFENMQLDIISQTWIISNYAHTQISSKLKHN
jgi:hypothetical protein